MTPVNPFILKNKGKMVAFLDDLAVSQIINHFSLSFLEIVDLFLYKSD